MKVFVLLCSIVLFFSATFAHELHQYEQFVLKTLPQTEGFKWFTWDLYNMSNPDDYLTEGDFCSFTFALDTLLYWFTDAGYFLHPWKNGDTCVILGSCEEDSGTSAHAGYYWLFSDTLNPYLQPQRWVPPDTLRIMPIPIQSQQFYFDTTIIEIQNPYETNRPPWGAEEYDVLGYWLVADTTESGIADSFDVNIGFVPVQGGPGGSTFHKIWPPDYFYHGYYGLYYAYYIVARPETTSTPGVIPGFSTPHMSQNSNMMIVLIDQYPPNAPYIHCYTAGNDVVVTWHPVTHDIFGNSEHMASYSVYRDTVADFIPNSDHRIAIVHRPDTGYVDSGALVSSEDFYYLVTATDSSWHTSSKSNMGYMLDESFNENPSEH